MQLSDINKKYRVDLSLPCGSFVQSFYYATKREMDKDIKTMIGDTSLKITSNQKDGKYFKFLKTHN